MKDGKITSLHAGEQLSRDFCELLMRLILEEVLGNGVYVPEQTIYPTEQTGQSISSPPT